MAKKRNTPRPLEERPSEIRRQRQKAVRRVARIFEVCGEPVDVAELARGARAATDPDLDELREMVRRSVEHVR